MFATLSARRAARAARRQYELARLERLMAENEAWLKADEARRSAPCKACEAKA